VAVSMAWCFSNRVASGQWVLVEDVVGPLPPAPDDLLSMKGNRAVGDRDLLADLEHLVPPGGFDSRSDEFCANVRFAERVFVYR